MFHKWLSTDDSDTDSCVNCGTASHVTMDGVVADYGPLPIDCPGPVKIPHHFILIGAVGDDAPFLDCARCSYTITANTRPADVNWECVEV